MYKITIEQAKRFDGSLSKEKECWAWTGPKTKSGHPIFWIENNWVTAHKISYLLSNKTFNGNEKIIRTCPEKFCLNPKHLKIETLAERFLKYVEKTESCWIWTGYFGTTGYGQFSVRNRCRKAHRVSYELFKGKLQKGLLVCHSCDNPKCVNPDHLWTGTPSDNMKDKVQKGRANVPFGSAHSKSILSEKQVLEIREKYTRGWANQFSKKEYSLKGLAKEYSVHIRTIHGVVYNKNWKHLNELS